MTKPPDHGWREFVLGSMQATSTAGFTPGPESPQPLSFAGVHVAPQDDPLAALPDAAATKMVALGQIAADLHGSIPMHEAVQEIRLEATGHRNRIADLERHPSEGGFGLDPSAPQFQSERRKLQLAERELARLVELREVRSARWAEAARLHQAVRDWLLRGGIPHGCTLETIEDLPLSELLTKADGGRIDAAVERCRLRLRELAASRHRVNSAPWPSSLAKTAARALIDRLADAGRPNLDGAIEFGQPISLTQIMLTSMVHNVDARGAVAYTETADTLGFVCWLLRDQILQKIDAGLDDIAENGSALDQQQRDVALAEIAQSELMIERAECGLIWTAHAKGENIDFRPTTSPQAVLGVRLIQSAHADPSPASSLMHSFDIIQPGGGRR